jgi:hypothetical protein
MRSNVAGYFGLPLKWSGLKGNALKVVQ